MNLKRPLVIFTLVGLLSQIISISMAYYLSTQSMQANLQFLNGPFVIIDMFFNPAIEYILLFNELFSIRISEASGQFSLSAFILYFSNILLYSFLGFTYELKVAKSIIIPFIIAIGVFVVGIALQVYNLFFYGM